MLYNFIFYQSYRMMLVFAVSVLSLLSITTSAPLDGKDLTKILVQVGTALNLMDDNAIQSYGVDPSILLFRDQINNLIPEDVLELGRGQVKLP